MDDKDPAGNNQGLTKRSTYTTRRKFVDLMAPIHSDIFFQEKLMLNGVDIKMRMIRGKDEFYLMRSDDVAYKLYIVSASLFVKKVTVAPNVRPMQPMQSNQCKVPD